MKTLTNYKVINFVIIAILISTTIAIILFLFLMKVDKSFTTKMRVDSLNNTHLRIDSDQFYELSKLNKIGLKINSEFYFARVKSLYYDNVAQELVLEIYDVPIQLIPNSTIDVVVITNTKTIIQNLFSR